ncbi:hypothetical protein [Kineosporia babensis]|uniref:Uncharacterized protein n=1 Tax=Kineosporia babensis TaxID=499548 RepID=A0A9X1STT4_9ACTN|nr:hypothetical protein [Kineosporia babensis]MCD5312207.1 hypothetical protein [Kineosporia babensis]
MFIELIALGLGLIVLLACVFGRLVANRNRTVDAFVDEVSAGPVIGAVTSDSLDDLPLVAPDQAGYGTASRLLVKAAQERAAAQNHTQAAQNNIQTAQPAQTAQPRRTQLAPTNGKGGSRAA